MYRDVYSTADAIGFAISELPKRNNHLSVLLVKPTSFQVRYRINPHMDQDSVIEERAQEQWNRLVEIYKRYTESVTILNPYNIWNKLKYSNSSKIEKPENVPDLVFCANQSLPYPDKKRVLIGQMATNERQPETEYLRYWFKEQGYETVELKINAAFEGMGDALWHPKHKLLFGGYGIRSEKAVYEEISQLLSVPVITLRLQSEKFYHLDLCLSLLDEQTALVYPDAIAPKSLTALQSVVDTLIEVPEYEAENGFACNAHCIDGNHVVIQSGNTETIESLQDSGFTVIETETSEFMKSGGSVFCMKLMLPCRVQSAK